MVSASLLVSFMVELPEELVSYVMKSPKVVGHYPLVQASSTGYPRDQRPPIGWTLCVG